MNVCNVLKIDQLASDSCVQLAELLLHGLRTGKIRNEGRALEFLPKFLQRLETTDSMTVASKGHCSLHISLTEADYEYPDDISGDEYKSTVVSRLCEMQWPSSAAITLATVFRDLILTAEQLQTAITKLLRQLKKLGLQELPPFVYQLLLLSGKGHKKIALNGIIDHFDWLDGICQNAKTDAMYGIKIDH